MAYGLGIDCGTTHTAAAVARDGAFEVLRLGARRAELPSLVFLPVDDPVVVGDAAARRGETEPSRLAREFKRRIGDPVPIMVGGTPLSAHALTARMLEHVVKVAKAGQGEAPASVVLTCPANWGPYKRDLLLQAAQLADLPETTLRSEPEAAAIEFAAGSRVRDGDVIAVYDLGGGTFDAAVLRRTPAGFDVLGQPEGIEQLGGMDFDEAVFEHVAAALPADKLAATDDPAVLAALARLRRDCVEAKEALSEDTEVMIPVALPSLHTRIRLTRVEFEAMIKPALIDTVASMRRALRSAGVSAAELSTILLSGGSSRIPLVSQLLSTEFQRPVVLDPHPEHSIALGAARVSQMAPSARAFPPIKQAPIKQAPIKQAAIKQAPAGRAGAGQAPVNQAPARQAPAKQAPRPLSPEEAVNARAVPVVPPATIRASASLPKAGEEYDSPVLLTREGLDLGMAPPPVTAPLASPGDKRARRRRLLQIGAAAVAALVIAGAAIYAVQRANAAEGDDDKRATPAVVTSAPPGCGFVDAFDGTTLDKAWEQTREDADVTVVGGAVTMDAPDGSDIYETRYTAPMLLRPWTGDFSLETEMTATPDQFYQGAGLVIWSGQKNYVRLELGWGDVRAIAFEYRNGGKHLKPHPPFQAGPNTVRTNADKVVLNLRRVGDTVNARWRRLDETAFTDLGTVDIALPDTVKVGVSVLNRAQSGTQPSPFSAEFQKASLSC